MMGAATRSSRPVRSAARRKAQRKQQRLVALLMAPLGLGLLIFFVFPLLVTAYLSFTRYDGLSPPRWVGLENYRFVFGKDPEVTRAAGNTMWMVVVGVPARVLVALGLSMMLIRVKRGGGVMRTVFYLPTLVPLVAGTLAFVYMFNPTTGPVNQILKFMHLGQPLWFNDKNWAKPSLLLLGLWGIGSSMIIVMAGLLDVPTHLYEAAAMDGAPAWRRFWHVTMPSISPVLLFSVLTAIIDGLQYFTQGYVASTVASSAGKTLGYPEGSTLFYSLWVFQQGFRDFNLGYASALSVVLFVVAVAVCALLVSRTRRFIYAAGAQR
jgi:multiple sugar transport system permease protein